MLRAVSLGAGGERFVYLWGGNGSGRSHLLQAVVHAAGTAGRAPIHLSAPAAAAAIDRLGGSDIVVLDDTERLDAPAQRALFGLYNRIRDAGGALAAGGAAAPTAIGVRADLATRLAWGLVYEVHALSDAEKAAAMSAHATARGFSLPPEGVEHVLRHGRRDLPFLLAFVELLDRYSLEAHRPVTLPLVREVLKLAQLGVEQD
jgi:DnaA family protein